MEGYYNNNTLELKIMTDYNQCSSVRKIKNQLSLKCCLRWRFANRLGQTFQASRLA